jgi:Protein of unknown function (DUF3105)
MASRKEQKEKLRQERLQREQAAAAAAGRRRRMGYVVAGGLVAAVIIAIAVIAFSGGDDGGGGSSASASDWPSGSVPKQKISDLDAAVKAAGCVYKTPKKEGAGHTTKPVQYKSQPPTSGSHDPVPAHDAANLTTPSPYESLVHALEHGRVIYWFKPNVPASVKGDLKALYDEDKDLVVLTPNSRPMPYEVAASAWGRFVGCPSYNDKVPDAFRAFRDAFRLKGPEYFPNAE